AGARGRPARPGPAGAPGGPRAGGAAVRRGRVRGPSRGWGPPARAPPPAPRTRRRTRWPVDVSAGTSAEPTSPLAPVTATVDARAVPAMSRPLCGRAGALRFRMACGLRVPGVLGMLHWRLPALILARVAKLADAPDLGSGGCKPLGGRLPPR